ncbi:unnamed protein product, partial [Linum tenue]
VGRRGQWRVQFVHHLHQAKVLHGVDKSSRKREKVPSNYKRCTKIKMSCW